MTKPLPAKPRHASLLFSDTPPQAVKVARLKAMDKADLAWLVSVCLEEASGPFAAMPAAEFWPLARAKLAAYDGAEWLRLLGQL